MRKILLIICLSLFTSANLIAQQSDVCSGPGFHQDIQKYLSQESPDLETVLLLSTSYQALGAGRMAHLYADKAIKSDPASAGAYLAKIHALDLLGFRNNSLALAKETFQKPEGELVFGLGERSWLRHSILAMLLEENELGEAEKMILDEFPNVPGLIERDVEPLSLDLGAPLHTFEALIHIYRATDREQMAAGLSRHLQGFSAESFFESSDQELIATQNWMLASIWAGTLDDLVVPALTMAYEKGFKMGWRFNYPHHPVYWPYRDDPAFLSLIARIEKDMATELACLD